MHKNGRLSTCWSQYLTLSWRRPISYRNQSIDLLRKSMDWFLYDIGLRHERVKKIASGWNFNGFCHFKWILRIQIYSHAKWTIQNFRKLNHYERNIFWGIGQKHVSWISIAVKLLILNFIKMIPEIYLRIQAIDLRFYLWR